MNGFLIFPNEQDAIDLIQTIDNCLGLPNGGTLTWQNGPLSYCSVGQTSGFTEFQGYVVKIVTERCGQCLTQQQIDDITQIPDDWGLCEI